MKVKIELTGDTCKPSIPKFIEELNKTFTTIQHIKITEVE
jgi:hypothetical protein